MSYRFSTSLAYSFLGPVRGGPDSGWGCGLGWGLWISPEPLRQLAPDPGAGCSYARCGWALASRDLLLVLVLVASHCTN